MNKILKKLLCKLTGHMFYSATEECSKTKCIKCGQWFDSEKAYGRWV